MSEHKKIWHLFGVRLHWGEPFFRTKIRAYTGSARLSKSGGPWTSSFTDHEIVRWYGVSFKLVGFLGWQRFGETSWPQEQGPIPYTSGEAA